MERKRPKSKLQDIRKTIQQEGSKDEMAKPIWSLSIPKAALLLWRVRWNRLPTLDCLERWGMGTNDFCLLCGDEKETLEHMFFNCRVSLQVLKGCLEKTSTNITLPIRQGTTLQTIAPILDAIMKGSELWGHSMADYRGMCLDVMGRKE